ncbi:hypothetical protein C8Q76DRAFT_634634 [Earliella scabrosa]|nr:hypothetical protein C8Q76DRAFT_634634 [Earliella scabrosa]
MAPPYIQLPPAVQDELDAAVNLLIIGAVFPAFLVPISIALIFFSTSAIRRKPVFIMNVLAVALGLAFGGVAIYNTSRTLSARPVNPDITIAMTCLYFFIPICVQCILLVRILAVYPPRTLSWSLWAAIYGPLTAVIVVRIVNASIAFRKIAEGTDKYQDAYVAAQIAWNLPYAKAEWFLQLLYDIYASALFLLRLREGGALRKDKDRLNIVLSNEASSMSAPHCLLPEIPLTASRPDPYASRLRTLFWLAVSNFIFPVIFNIVQLVIVFRDRNFTHGVYVVSANIYVEIVCVLLATLWCSETYWNAAASIALSGAKPGSSDADSTQSLDSVKFASASVVVSEFRPESSS